MSAGTAHAMTTAAALAAVVALSAGCSTSRSAQGTQGVDQGYVAGDGSLVRLAVDDREDPIEASG